MESPIISDRQTDRQTELFNCNFVKTILMLVVVIYHCMIYWSRDWFVGEPIYDAPILATIAQWMNTFHTQAFTLTSGYLFYYLKCEKGNYDRFLPFAVNKAKRLLIPYVFAASFWVIPFAVYYFEYSAWDILIRFGLGTSPSQLWFLLMLFEVFMVFYPLSGVFQQHNISGLLIVVFFYGVGIVIGAVFPDYFQFSRACMYSSLFWIGFKIRQYGSRYLRMIPVPVWMIGDVILFAAYRFLYEMDGVICTLLYLGVRFLLYIVGALTAFIVLQKLADYVKWKKSRAFKLLTKYSMPIYLFHQQVVYVFVSLLNGRISPYIHVGVNFIGAMIVSTGIAVLLMKFKCTRFMMGEK